MISPSAPRCLHFGGASVIRAMRLFPRCPFSSRYSCKIRYSDGIIVRCETRREYVRGRIGREYVPGENNAANYGGGFVNNVA